MEKWEIASTTNVSLGWAPLAVHIDSKAILENKWMRRVNRNHSYAQWTWLIARGRELTVDKLYNPCRRNFVKIIMYIFEISNIFGKMHLIRFKIISQLHPNKNSITHLLKYALLYIGNATAIRHNWMCERLWTSEAMFPGLWVRLIVKSLFNYTDCPRRKYTAV